MKTVILSSVTAPFVEEPDCLNLFWTFKPYDRGTAIYGFSGIYFDKDVAPHNLENYATAYLIQTDKSRYDSSKNLKSNTYYAWKWNNTTWTLDFPESDVFFNNEQFNDPKYPFDDYSMDEWKGDYLNINLINAICEINKRTTDDNNLVTALEPLWEAHSLTCVVTDQSVKARNIRLPKNQALNLVERWQTLESVKRIISILKRMDDARRILDTR